MKKEINFLTVFVRGSRLHYTSNTTAYNRDKNQSKKLNCFDLGLFQCFTACVSRSRFNYGMVKYEYIKAIVSLGRQLYYV